MSDAWVLLREFSRAPARTATVAASSDALVAEMLRPFPAGDDPVVVELGAGTGRVTGAVQDRLGGRGRHLAVEINPLLAERLARRHPQVTVVCADAATLPRVLAAEGVVGVDLVVSLLPWAAHRDGTIPQLVADVLAPGGAFTQIVLAALRRMGPARRLDAATRAAFPDVRLGPTVWRNLPPARVRRARRP